MNPRTVLITGASSGIGSAFAEVFAAEGFDLVITARREDRLRNLAALLAQRDQCGVHVVVADLSAVDAPARMCDNLISHGLVVDALVNNAGYGVPGAYRASEWTRMDAPSVAREGFDAVMRGTPIHVTGIVNRTIALLARYVPQPILVAIGRRTARRYRKS
jgi:NAD(P)-dependent dehydrogenase (short-subunit alcohol dehydrogenase family)